MLEFNTSNSGSRGTRFKPRQFRCFLRQGALLHLVSLLPVYKWVPATFCWWVTMRWTSIPSRGE